MNNVQNKINDLILIGFIFSFFLGPVGAILCYFGLEQIKETGEAGRHMAIAGLIIGTVPLALTIIFLITCVLVYVIFLLMCIILLMSATVVVL